MKKLLTILLITNTLTILGQDTLNIPYNCSCKIDKFKGQEVFTIVEKMPNYQDGTPYYMKLIKDNIELRKSQSELQKSIYLTFVIDTMGNVTNKCLERTFYPDRLTELEKSGLLALDKMGKWTPGEQSGKKVPVKFVLPIKIHLR